MEKQKFGKKKTKWLVQNKKKLLKTVKDRDKELYRLKKEIDSVRVEAIKEKESLNE